MRLRLAGLFLWFSLHAAPALAAPGRLGGGGGVEISLVRIITVSVLGVMLAVLAALLLKRGGGRIDLAVVRRMFVALPAARRIQVIESRRVSQHADLCLVRCDEEEYLILCSARRQQIVRRRDAAGAAKTDPASGTLEA